MVLTKHKTISDVRFKYESIDGTWRRQLRQDVVFLISLTA